MNSFRTRENRWIALNLCFAALLAGAALANQFWLQPRLAAADRLANESVELGGKLAVADSRRESLQAQKDRLGSEARRLRDFREKGLPGPYQAQGDLQRVIYRAAASSGLPVNGVHYARADVGEKKSLRRLSADFSVQGSYAQVKSFLAAVESAPEFALIDDYGLTDAPAAPGTAVSVIDLKLKLSVFFQPAGQPVGQAAGAGKTAEGRRAT